MHNYVSKAQTTIILIRNHKYTSNNEHHKKHYKDTQIHWTLHKKFNWSHKRKIGMHKHDIDTKHQTLTKKILTHFKIHINMSLIHCKTQSYKWNSKQQLLHEILHWNSWSQGNRKTHQSMYTIKAYKLVIQKFNHRTGIQKFCNYHTPINIHIIKTYYFIIHKLSY